MSNFIVALNVVFPLVFLISLGYWAKEKKIVSKESFKQLNKLVYNVMVPTVLMKNVMETDLSIAFQPKLILYSVLSIILTVAVSWIITHRFVSDKKRAGVIIQSTYRSNYVLFGLVIVSNMYGADNVAVTTMLIAFCVPLYNMLAVIILQYHSMDHVDFKSLFKGMIKNPMLIGTFIGLFILLSGIELPVFIQNSINDVSKSATPLALIILGGTFEVQSVAKNKLPLIITTFVRLIFVPFVFLAIAVLMGYRQVELFSLLALYGSPVAVGSYAMAQAMNCDEEFAGQSVLVTTIFSIFSMLFWITLLNGLGLV